MASDRVSARRAVLGLDIGGATLKACDALGQARSLPFPLWKHPDQLSAALRSLIAPFQPVDLAVTMTGELCDCFETRAAGVRSILDALVEAHPHPDRIWVWQTERGFVRWSEAGPMAAAANFMALAQWAATQVPIGTGLCIDIGSTTTDIIPIRDRAATPIGRSDPDRLASGELVYVGIERTPLCALLPTVRLNGRVHRTMAEWFATTQDVYLTLGDLSERTAHHATADGRPATVPLARDRLARMIGADRSCFTSQDAIAIAEQAREAQLARIDDAIAQVVDESLGGRVDHVIITGSGEFLARLLRGRGPLKSARWTSIAERWSHAVSQAACAFAVASLLDSDRT